MSLQDYVDNKLVGSGSVSHAAIIGLDGSTKAKSAALNFTNEEAQELLKTAFVEGTIRVTFASKGFINLKNDERAYYGKVVGSGGIVIVKTKQNVVIGIYEAQQPGTAVYGVEQVAVQLEKNNL